jgi:hypothetical protein
VTLSSLLVQDVIVRRNAAATTDAEGNTTRPADDDVTYRGRLGQQAAVETLTGSPTTEQVRWLLYLPAGATIGPRDRVVVDGVTYEVDGQPYRALDGTGAEHHVEARLVGVS